jgi:CheY-like chemotaxis protein
MVRNTERILRRLIGENIELHVVLDPDVGLIRADPTQLDQVILNLAVNARDAMPTGGRLQVSTAQVSVGSGSALARVDVPPGRYALLEVADSGSGIEPAILGKIWEPFFTTKAVGKGTGLGLATVYGIVSQSGGHIVVRSTPGEGTTFGVYFPRVDEAVSEPDAPATKAASGVETVLMVEDEPMVRCLVRTVLEQAGYRVLEAGCGEEALEVAADYPDYIDLLLTDVVIPGKTNGRLLADTLCAERKGLRVLYMSGYTDDAVLAQGIQQAEVAFLQKPFGPAVLAARVREVLDEGGPRDGA